MSSLLVTGRNGGLSELVKSLVLAIGRIHEAALNVFNHDISGLENPLQQVQCLLDIHILAASKKVQCGIAELWPGVDAQVGFGDNHHS